MSMMTVATDAEIFRHCNVFHPTIDDEILSEKRSDILPGTREDMNVYMNLSIDRLTRQKHSPADSMPIPNEVGH